ncbi:MAG: ATP-binding protein [Microcoleaceae cyanobacterium]
MATILWVEDAQAQDRETSLNWQGLLGERGHEVEKVANRTEAEQYLSQTPPEVLIYFADVSAIASSDPRGLSFIKRIKDNPNYASIFCILVTPPEQFSQASQQISEWIDDWIAETTNPNEFIWRLQSSLKTYRLTQSFSQVSQQFKRVSEQLVHQEKMSSLGQMVSGIAHEMNNPVSVVKGNINHIAEYVQDLTSILELYAEAYPEPTPEIQACIEEVDLEFLMDDLPQVMDSMKSSAERIRQLVQSLRNFYQLDDTATKPFDVNQCIEDVLLIFQGALKGKKGRRIQVVKDYGSICRIECYPGQINQVLVNLLKNAVDALEIRRLEEGSTEPTIWIQTQSLADTQPSHVQISIRDNGVGIPFEIQDKIFDPFFTTKLIGAGIGLDISHQIVKHHYGELKCVSQSGEGTEFIISLPIEHPDGEDVS